MERIGERTRGEIYEGIAFQFCKVATVALLCGRWTLPAASLLCAVFFVMAHFGGKRDTRCFLKYPLLAAGIFLAVGIGAVWWNLRP